MNKKLLFMFISWIRKLIFKFKFTTVSISIWDTWCLKIMIDLELKHHNSHDYNFHEQNKYETEKRRDRWSKISWRNSDTPDNKVQRRYAFIIFFQWKLRFYFRNNMLIVKSNLVIIILVRREKRIRTCRI